MPFCRAQLNAPPSHSSHIKPRRMQFFTAIKAINLSRLELRAFLARQGRCEPEFPRFVVRWKFPVIRHVHGRASSSLVTGVKAQNFKASTRDVVSEFVRTLHAFFSRGKGLHTLERLNEGLMPIANRAARKEKKRINLRRRAPRVRFLGPRLRIWP